MEEKNIPVTWLKKGDIVTAGSWNRGMIDYPCLVVFRQVTYSSDVGPIRKIIDSITLLDPVGKRLIICSGYTCDAIRRNV